MSGKILLLRLVLVPLQPHWEVLSRSRAAGKFPHEESSATPVFSVGCLPCPVLVRDTLEAGRCQSGKDRFLLERLLCDHPQPARGVHSTKESWLLTAGSLPAQLCVSELHCLSLPDHWSRGSKNVNEAQVLELILCFVCT